jgi:glycosyltransferase involved in cell wall biosynthesis
MLTGAHSCPAIRPLKILSLTTLYPNAVDGGAGLFVRSRLQHLAALADIRVVAPVCALRYAGGRLRLGGLRSVPAQWQDARLVVVHPRWASLPGAGLLNAALLALALIAPVWRLRREFPFDVIDAHFGYPDGIAAALLARVFRRPFVVTFRGSEVEHARRPIRGAAMRWMVRRASRAIAVAENLRTLATSLGCNPSRAVTISNGVNANVFYPRAREACRAKLGVAPERRLIAAAGHLIRLKGHHHIIRAVERLRGRGMDVELLIAGDTGKGDGFDRELRALAGAPALNGRVRFLGLQPPAALAELMSACDVFCLASSREGWPNVVHEALSCGAPVVATAVGAVPQMIAGPEYGVIVPVEKADELDVALEQALVKAWDREAIAAKGGARSWDRVAGELAEEMEAACRRSSCC